MTNLFPYLALAVRPRPLDSDQAEQIKTSIVGAVVRNPPSKQGKLSTTHRPPSTTHRPSSIIHRPLSIVHRPSSIVHRPSSIVHCLFPFLLLLFQCQSLKTDNENNPALDDVLSTGNDLEPALKGAYAGWWLAVHDDHPAIGLSVAADAFTMSWGNFGAYRMGLEPRAFYNNRTTEEMDYQQIITDPWYGCLSAVSTANDVLRALSNGVDLDNGGPQDKTLQASAYMLRGLCWGYLALLFDETLTVDETVTNFTTGIEFTGYKEAAAKAVSELEKAIGLATEVGVDFEHTYFNGIGLDAAQFNRLCHSYIARFQAQWPRTPEENAQVDWQSVWQHGSKGIEINFAPLADGKLWQSYQSYVFAEAGIGPFWARIDQRIIAAMSTNQPPRYPGPNDPPLPGATAQSADKRLTTDFIFLPIQNFPADRGTWYYSHYKLNRNKTEPGFAGDGSSAGPMPVFLAADNQLLVAEALMHLNRLPEAISLLNAGARVKRGQLAPLPSGASLQEVEKAVFYERTVELLGSAPMGLWFDRRRLAARVDPGMLNGLGGLQKGTPAQLPVPAQELRIFGDAPYNFGGPNDPGGVERVF